MLWMQAKNYAIRRLQTTVNWTTENDGCLNAARSWATAYVNAVQEGVDKVDLDDTADEEEDFHAARLENNGITMVDEFRDEFFYENRTRMRASVHHYQAFNRAIQGRGKPEKSHEGELVEEEQRRMAVQELKDQLEEAQRELRAKEALIALICSNAPHPMTKELRYVEVKREVGESIQKAVDQNNSSKAEEKSIADEEFIIEHHEYIADLHRQIEEAQKELRAKDLLLQNETHTKIVETSELHKYIAQLEKKKDGNAN